MYKFDINKEFRKNFSTEILPVPAADRGSRGRLSQQGINRAERDIASHMILNGNITVNEIARQLNVRPPTAIKLRKGAIHLIDSAAIPATQRLCEYLVWGTLMKIFREMIGDASSDARRVLPHA